MDDFLSEYEDIDFDENDTPRAESQNRRAAAAFDEDHSAFRSAGRKTIRIQCQQIQSSGFLPGEICLAASGGHSQEVHFAIRNSDQGY